MRRRRGRCAASASRSGRAGGRPEIPRAQLHEALLNVAVDPDTPLWLRCPYDVSALSQAELAEAARSHPILVKDDDYAGSRTYGGMQHVEDLFGDDLAEPAGPVAGIVLPAGPAEIAAFVGRHAAEVGLTPSGPGRSRWPSGRPRRRPCPAACCGSGPSRAR